MIIKILYTSPLVYQFTRNPIENFRRTLILSVLSLEECLARAWARSDSRYVA